MKRLFFLALSLSIYASPLISMQLTAPATVSTALASADQSWSAKHPILTGLMAATLIACLQNFNA